MYKYTGCTGNAILEDVVSSSGIKCYQYTQYNPFSCNSSLILASCAVDRETYPRSSLIKNNEIGIFCFSAGHTAVRSNVKRLFR